VEVREIPLSPDRLFEMLQNAPRRDPSPVEAHA
jgi:hypothetical protein